MENVSILIVEDESISAMNLQRKLEKLGYSISGIASTAAAAIREAADSRPQLVLMDINLKGIESGIEAAKRIAEMNIPVVFLSAFSDENTIKQAKETNPFGYLVKPVEEKSLHTAIEIALYRHQLQNQLNEEIKARKQAEVELKKSNEDLEQFALVASHDLREPLRTMSCYLGLIERELKDKLSPSLKENFAFVLDAAPRMQNLIEDLLAYSHVGKKQNSFQQVDCNEVYQTTIANLLLAIKESGAVITTSSLPVLFADAREIGQVFQNLLANAIKYRDGRIPKIQVRCEKQEKEWCFSVEDNGIGVPLKSYEKIFVVFSRLHSRSTYEGTGIGLATCKKIVEAHQGRIWVESREGEGSTFFFTLPCNN